MTGASPATGPVDERPPHGVAAVVLGVLLLLAMSGLSRVPWTAAEDPDGLLRLSWRFQGRMGERCRTLSPDELAELPVHMRNPDACRQEGLAYRLRVAVDDELLVDRVIEPAGARGDRPVYVLDQVALDPGTHRVRATFEVDGGDGTGDPGGAGEAPAGRADESAGLRWNGTVKIEKGRVLLLTRDADTGDLELRGTAPGTGR